MRSSRSLLPLPATLVSPGSVCKRTLVFPSRATVLTIVARGSAYDCSKKPQSVGELAKAQENETVEEAVEAVGAQAGKAAPRRSAKMTERIVRGPGLLSTIIEEANSGPCSRIPCHPPYSHGESAMVNGRTCSLQSASTTRRITTA